MKNIVISGYILFVREAWRVGRRQCLENEGTRASV